MVISLTKTQVQLVRKAVADALAVLPVVPVGSEEFNAVFAARLELLKVLTKLAAREDVSAHARRGKKEVESVGK
jgi:hypothetical protein